MLCVFATSMPRSAPRFATRSTSATAASTLWLGMLPRPAKRSGCVAQKSASQAL